MYKIYFTLTIFELYLKRVRINITQTAIILQRYCKWQMRKTYTINLKLYISIFRIISYLQPITNPVRINN